RRSPDNRALYVQRLDSRALAADEANRFRTKSRRPHVVDHFAIGHEPANDDPRRGIDANFPLRRQAAVAYEDDEATGAIAALLDFPAVRVEDPIAKVGVRRDRRLDDEHLIAARAEAPIGK